MIINKITLYIFKKIAYNLSYTNTERNEMLATIRPVDMSKRNIKSEFYTFSEQKGLKLFELVIMPYHGDLDLDIDDQELEIEGLEFLASSQKTALFELTNNISLAYKHDLFSVGEYEGFRSQNMKDLYKDINGLDLNLDNFTIGSFLDLNDHYCYVLRKLIEKIEDLNGINVKLIDKELYFIDENQQHIKIKDNLKK